MFLSDTGAAKGEGQRTIDGVYSTCTSGRPAGFRNCSSSFLACLLDANFTTSSVPASPVHFKLFRT